MIPADHIDRRISPASILATLREMVDRLPPGAGRFQADDEINAEMLAEQRGEERKHGERVSDWTADRMDRGAA